MHWHFNDGNSFCGVRATMISGSRYTMSFITISWPRELLKAIYGAGDKYTLAYTRSLYTRTHIFDRKLASLVFRLIKTKDAKIDTLMIMTDGRLHAERVRSVCSISIVFWFIQLYSIIFWYDINIIKYMLRDTSYKLWTYIYINASKKLYTKPRNWDFETRKQVRQEFVHRLTWYYWL